MSNTSRLDHPPENIIREALIAAGVGTDPDDKDAWPVFVSSEPDRSETPGKANNPIWPPDSIITVIGTTPVDLGRIQITGQRKQDYGIQILVRSPAQVAGGGKASEIAAAIEEDSTAGSNLYRSTVTLGAATYLLHRMSKVNGPLAHGTGPSGKLRRWSINALAAIEQTA